VVLIFISAAWNNTEFHLILPSFASDSLVKNKLSTGESLAKLGRHKATIVLTG
jgi:hypothetical protein